MATRVSSGHIIMLLAGALGLLLTVSLLRTAGNTQPVLVAARDLAPGTVLDAGNVRVSRVHVDASVLTTLIPGDRPASIKGQVVVGSVRGGALLTHDLVRSVDAHAATRVMSVPIARAKAVDGRLVAGDHVDVLGVDHDTGRAGYVLTDAEVVTVDGHSSGALSGASDDVTVTLVVDGATAPRLASAVAAGTVMLVRSTGAAPLPNDKPFEVGDGA